MLESLKIQAYSEPLPVELDRIHCANGIYFLDGHFEPKKVFCNNRLSVSYNPAAPKPLRWLQFLSELLEEDDILTLQEYLGYCLIPSTKRSEDAYADRQRRRGKIPYWFDSQRHVSQRHECGK